MTKLTSRAAAVVNISQKAVMPPGLLHRLDTHHGLFALGILEVTSDK
jgi:hypothetical protein